MRFQQTTVCLVLAFLACSKVQAETCILELSEFRSGKPLTRLELKGPPYIFTIAFTHSVLNTPVSDRYIWQPDKKVGHARIVEELFEGEGYGLPDNAAPGEIFERIQTDDGPRWRLSLDRRVEPLAVLPLASQKMRIEITGQPAVLLGSLSNKTILVQGSGCNQ